MPETAEVVDLDQRRAALTAVEEQPAARRILTEDDSMPRTAQRAPSLAYTPAASART